MNDTTLFVIKLKYSALNDVTRLDLKCSDGLVGATTIFCTTPHKVCAAFFQKEDVKFFQLANTITYISSICRG